MSPRAKGRERPGWATRLEGADRVKRLVPCGACGTSVRFDRMAAHLRDACPGQPEDRESKKEDAA